MPHQTFPWEEGESMSPAKLLALNPPKIKGKSVLDVGCNAGFFCGFAHFRGASQVVGVDNDPEAIATARELFPDCQFLLQDWQDLTEGKYDIIFYLDGLNYARDPEAMLASLVDRLAPDGVLVLEVGYVRGSDATAIEEDGNIAHYPTLGQLQAMLDKYAFKYMGSTRDAKKGGCGRNVYHLRKKMPLAVLLMDAGHSGKTAVSTTLFRQDIIRISGDVLYYEIMLGKREASEAFREIIAEWSNGKDVNCAAVSFKICRAGLLAELCEMARKIAGERDFILDMYVPSQCRRQMCGWWDARGYFVIDVALFHATAKPGEPDTSDAEQTCRDYLDYLGKDFLLDEADYLAANPGVAEAVAAGLLPSAQYHYWKYGKKEGRTIKPPKR